MSDERRTGEQPPTPDEQGHAPLPQGPVEHAQLDDPWLLDRLLSGEAGEEWSSVTELLAAAVGPTEPDELRGERAAVTSFQSARAAAATRREQQGGTAGRGARRVAVVSTLMAGKFAAVTVAGIVTLGAGGMAAAAYTGILPAPLQDVAHRTIGAPLPNRTGLLTTPTPTPEPSPSATTSDPTSAPSRQSGTSATTTSAVQPARPVADLCADWRQQQLSTVGPAIAVLTQAAGSTSIDAFCASLTTPTTEPTATPSETPTTDPTATPSDTASPSETSTPSPTTASDSPTTPPMTASDQPTAPTQQPTTSPTNKPTGP